MLSGPTSPMVARQPLCSQASTFQKVDKQCDSFSSSSAIQQIETFPSQQTLWISALLCSATQPHLGPLVELKLYQLLCQLLMSPPTTLPLD